MSSYVLLAPTEPPVPSEFTPIFESLERCLDLRDKYMSRSGQKLGFDPRDHDGVFSGLDDDVAGVSGVRPDADFATRLPPKSPFSQWRLYPRPPPPHWHWKGKGTSVPQSSGDHIVEDEEFDKSACEIPAGHDWNFAIDEKGVFQIYEGEGTCIFDSCVWYAAWSCLRRSGHYSLQAAPRRLPNGTSTFGSSCMLVAS